MEPRAFRRRLRAVFDVLCAVFYVCLFLNFSFAAMLFLPGTSTASEKINDVIPANENLIELNIGNAKYRIPRNYISRMSDWNGGPQTYVIIRVTYPGLKPFGAEARVCAHQRASCRTYEVTLRDKANIRQDGIFGKEGPEHPERGEPGPYGFTLFAEGEENARWNLYRKTVSGSVFVFVCPSSRVGGKIYAVCAREAHASSGATLTYIFGENQLRDAIDVDQSLRKLVDGFFVGKNK
jgi:hypothetical protein